jgi:hypothetical protein
VTAQCCTGGGPSRRPARRLSAAAASILPAAALLLLPKCPLCIAAWLTLATGIAIPAAAVAGLRGLIVLFWITALAIAAGRMRTIHINRSSRSRSYFNQGMAASDAAPTRRSRPVKFSVPSLVSSPIQRFPKPSSVSVLVCPPTKANPDATGATWRSSGV